MADAAIPEDISDLMDSLVIQELNLTNTKNHDELMSELITHVNNNKDFFSTD